MTKLRLLEKVTFENIAPAVRATVKVSSRIRRNTVDYIVGLAIHRVRKIIRASK